jgi:long-subunit fatty acid transport protein
MKKLYFTLVTLIGLMSVASAQYVDNALFFSQQYYGSTARLKAMGNAFGALGGDFGALSINPAGIGIYQRGELSMTISPLNQSNTETTYQGNTYQQNNNNFNFKNLGYVSVVPMRNSSSGVVSFNFGLGYNRLANLNSNSYINASNVPYSRMDAFAQNTNGIKYTDLVSTDTYDPYKQGVPWESKLAWENYLIEVTNPNTGGDQYSTFLFSDETVKQLESVSHEGFINEYVASFGANFGHKLYCGMTFGMQDLFYDEAKMYSESGNWGKFDYTNAERTSGIGYNFKFGLIYRPIPVLRIGAAIHTPTYYYMKESYSSVMSSNLIDIYPDANGTHYEETPLGTYEYDYNTPLRFIGSIAYQFAKKGLLSFDYEFVDYGNMKYKHGSDGYQFGSENTSIKEIYGSVNNFRAGAEYRITDAFSLRGGMEFIGNPYKSKSYGVDQPNADYKFTSYNGGIGYRAGVFSADLTYSLGNRTNYMYMYQVDGFNVEPVKYNTHLHEILFTFAIRM